MMKYMIKELLIILQMFLMKTFLTLDNNRFEKLTKNENLFDEHNLTF